MVYVIDPCGRTWIGLCDHKGRRFLTTQHPLVFGSTSLDQGLAEWHPIGCSMSSDLSDLSDPSDKAPCPLLNLSRIRAKIELQLSDRRDATKQMTSCNKAKA